jgi:hypothetical protein
MANPTVRRDGVIAMQVAGETILQDDSGRELARLSPLGAAVFLAADGSLSVAGIAERASAALGAGVEVEAVWAALDALADVDLLEARATPPGSMAELSRRRLLTRVGGGMAGAAALAAGTSVMAKTLAGEAEGKAVRSDLEKTKEQAQKEGHKRSPSDLAAKNHEQTQKEGGHKGAPSELASSREQKHKASSTELASSREQKHKASSIELASSREQKHKSGLA